MMRRVVVAIVMTVALTACWEQSGFDAGNSGSSSLPSGVTPANVAGLTHTFTAPAGRDSSGTTAVISGGHLFVTGLRLLAYDAGGNDGCTGPTPSTCIPQWSSSEATTFGDLVVGGGRVWAVTEDHISGYDVAGIAGCSGIPLVCAPVVTISPGVSYLGGLRWTGNALHFMGSGGSPRTGFHGWHFAYGADGSFRWQADLGVSAIPTPIATVGAGGVVIAAGHGASAGAYDATGSSGCGGVPRTCVPMWTYDGLGSLMVRDGRFFTQKNGHTAAYDALGVTGCGGVPKVCEPLWSTSGTPGAAVVDADHLFVMHDEGTEVYSLGGPGCSGNPVVCSPLWTNAPTGTPYSIVSGSVAGGVIYTVTDSCPGGNCGAVPVVRVDAHDASGAGGCGGSPRVCTPRWTATFPYLVGGVLIVGDIVYVVGRFRLGLGAADPEVRAFRTT
ncbi:MAG: hypothetical protein ACXVLO_18860 [Acidimicrobiia bacterium]